MNEEFCGRGIATAFSEMIVWLAEEPGIKGFTAEMLQAGQKIMKIPAVFLSAHYLTVTTGQGACRMTY